MTEPAGLARAAAATVVLELRRVRRSRAVLISTFLAPLVMAVIVVLALGNIEEPEPVELGIVDETASPRTAAAIAELTQSPELADVVEWRTVPSKAAAVAEVSDEQLGAALVIEERSDRLALQVIGEEDPIASGVAAMIADEVAVAAAARQLGLVATEGSDGTDSGERVIVTVPGGRGVDASVYWGPAIGVFFVLASIGYAASRQVDDQRLRIADRAVASLGSTAATSLGRALVASTLGTLSLLTMALGTQLFFDRSWGSWPQVLAVSLATGLAAAGLGALVAGFANTPSQAQTVSAVAAFALAIGGGAFSPPDTAPIAGAVTRWLPSTLSLDAFSVVTTTGRGTQLVQPISVMVGTGLAMFLAAALISNRRSHR